MLFLQSMTQLKSSYKDAAETIIDCCDSMVFLGGKSTNTTKAVSEMIGQATIDNQNINVSRGETGSYSVNNQVMGRALIDPSEVGRLRRSECIVLISGENPFRSQKYKLEKHKRYKYISDSDPNNRFDINKIKRGDDKAKKLKNDKTLYLDYGDFSEKIEEESPLSLPYSNLLTEESSL